MDQTIVIGVSQIILEGYSIYKKDFKKITKKATAKFEQRDWLGIQHASNERLNLYKNKVQEIVRVVRLILGDLCTELRIWKRIKQYFSSAIVDYKDYEILETFYNSICRKVFGNIGTNHETMFVTSDHEHRAIKSKEPIYHTYWGNGRSAKAVVKSILLDYRFNVPYEDMERDLNFMVDKIHKTILKKYKPDSQTRVEVLKPIFYRNKAAYIIGRTYIGGKILPFVVPLLHESDGVYVDTLIFDYNDLSIIFSFTRSYFLVEIDIPSEFVAFLSSLMPDKNRFDIYNSIGYNKHGKTESYRHFLRYLEMAGDEKFVTAPGIKGMVMCVFTLPSYDVVFKLIKDKFDPPKKGTVKQVKEKYKLVSRHDRVGRMADTHEFENFLFEKDRFSEDLLAELQAVAPSIVEIRGDKVLIKHLYTERKMIPLNLYLDSINDDKEKAKEAVDEYGNAIKQLAAANIFPGDMLLKNFGVTRHRRVVFYDYDEICFLTECNFRRIPEPRDIYEEYASEAWYAVGENDIFPEEFKKFLIGHNSIRKLFYDLHGDIFDVKFWRKMQERQEKGEIIDVFPYRRKKRFRDTRKSQS